MPHVQNHDVTLHVDVDGDGSRSRCSRTVSPTRASSWPHSRRWRPARRCGSASADTDTRARRRDGAYSFADFASDLDAVATDSYGATHAVGHVVGRRRDRRTWSGDEPDRFERIVFLLPAALDRPIGDHSVFDRTAELLESLPEGRGDRGDPVASPDASGSYDENPGLREFDVLLWQDMNPSGVARAIRAGGPRRRRSRTESASAQSPRRP